MSVQISVTSSLFIITVDSTTVLTKNKTDIFVAPNTSDSTIVEIWETSPQETTRNIICSAVYSDFTSPTGTTAVLVISAIRTLLLTTPDILIDASMVVGNPVVSGTPKYYLYVDASGNLADSGSLLEDGGTRLKSGAHFLSEAGNILMDFGITGGEFYEVTTDGGAGLKQGIYLDSNPLTTYQVQLWESTANFLRMGASQAWFAHDTKIKFDSPIYNFAQLTASTVPYIDSSKDLISSTITPVELGYLSGTTSNIQAQLNALTGAFKLLGSTDCSANPNYPAGAVGDAYYVSVAGKIGGASGKDVDLGDIYVCKTANAGGNEAAVGADWFVLEHNLTGVALTTNPLSQFAATTSAQLAGVISDETGSGALVFGTSPTLSNPIVGTQSARDGSTKAASTLYTDNQQDVNLSIWRHCRETGLIISSAAAVATYWTTVQLNGTAAIGYTSDNTQVVPPGTFYIAAADYPSISGLTAKLRIVVQQFTNHTAPGINFTFDLRPVTAPASSGGAGVRSHHLGSSVTGSSVSINTPSADTNTYASSSSFALPADGMYVVCITTSGTSATNSFTEHILDLQIHYE